MWDNSSIYNSLKMVIKILVKILILKKDDDKGDFNHLK